MTEPQQGREHSQQATGWTKAYTCYPVVLKGLPARIKHISLNPYKGKAEPAIARLEVVRREVGKKIASDVIKARLGPKTAEEWAAMDADDWMALHRAELERDLGKGGLRKGDDPPKAGG